MKTEWWNISTMEKKIVIDRQHLWKSRKQRWKRISDRIVDYQWKTKYKIPTLEFDDGIAIPKTMRSANMHLHQAWTYWENKKADCKKMLLVAGFEKMHRRRNAIWETLTRSWFNLYTQVGMSEKIIVQNLSLFRTKSDKQIFWTLAEYRDPAS